MLITPLNPAVITRLATLHFTALRSVSEFKFNVVLSLATVVS
jgi:hypothetical protein